MRETGQQRLRELLFRPPVWLRIAIGLVAIWPAVCILGQLAFAQISGHDLLDGPGYVATVISAWLVILAFILDANFSPRVPPQKRNLWVVVLFLGHFVAAVVYWYFYIWRPRSVGEGGEVE